MIVHFMSAYYSEYAHKNLSKRTPPYWDAYLFVWAVKFGTYKTKFIIPLVGGKTLQITEKNVQVVRDYFGQFIVRTLDAQNVPADALIIPVPSKDALMASRPSSYRSLDMVKRALRGRKYGNAIFDGLRWKIQLQKAHEGGSRDRSYWREHLQASSHLQGRSVVLIDDVLSTGSTILAAKEELEAAGATVLFGIACGRTVYDFEAKPFRRQTIEFEQEIHEHPGAG